MRILLIIAFCTVPAAALSGQNPGTNLTADVTVQSVVVSGDTVRTTYLVYNRPTSRDSLDRFNVHAPAGVKSIMRPQPDSDYLAMSTYRGRPVANWALLGLLAPGWTSVPFSFESVGLPDTVTAWVGGHFPLPQASEADTLPEDALKYHAVAGKTVGVTPWPVDRSAKSLISRLRARTQTSCAAPLTWITSSTLCTKLIGYLDQAEANRAAGKVTQAKSAMNSYIASLSGKTPGTFATGVTNPGYWLLRPNADIVIKGL